VTIGLRSSRIQNYSRGQLSSLKVALGAIDPKAGAAMGSSRRSSSVRADSFKRLADSFAKSGLPIRDRAEPGTPRAIR